MSHFLETEGHQDFWIREGSLVLFEVSKGGLLAQIDNIVAQEAVMAFPTKKYVGMVRCMLDTWDSPAVLCIAPVATSLPHQDLLDDICPNDPEEAVLRSAFLKLDASPGKPRHQPGSRPVLRPSPRLPWSNCILYTCMDEGVCVTAVHEKKGRNRITTLNAREVEAFNEVMQRDQGRIDQHCRDVMERRDILPADPQATRLAPLALTRWTPDEENSSVGSPFNAEMLQQVVTIWEELSLIKEVPDPVGYLYAFNELKKIISRCYTQQPNPLWKVNDWQVSEQVQSPEPGRSPSSESQCHDEDDLPLGADAVTTAGPRLSANSGVDDHHITSGEKDQTSDLRVAAVRQNCVE